MVNVVDVLATRALKFKHTLQSVKKMCHDYISKYIKKDQHV